MTGRATAWARAKARARAKAGAPVLQGVPNLPLKRGQGGPNLMGALHPVS